MKKGLFLCVAFLVLFILLSGCNGSNKNTQQSHKHTTQVKQIPYRQFLEIKSGVSTNLNAIAYNNSAKGITVGDHGTILLTKNSGYNWQAVGGVTSVNLYGVAMVDELAIAVGENGTILRSVNAGETWTVKTISSGTLKAVAFDTYVDGYTVGDNGLIFVTHDAGVQWTKVGNSSANFSAIAYNKNNLPQIVGNNGALMSDTSFYPSVIDNGPNLRSINFIPDSDTGFAVCDKGVILKTTDGGSNWNPESSLVTKNLRSVFLHSSKLGYAVGDDGTVLRYNGDKWEPMTSSTTKTLNAVDPVYWNPTSTCVGENGEIILINPPPVQDGTTDSLNGLEDCTLAVTLYTNSLTFQGPYGDLIIYQKLETCSSLEQQYEHYDRPGSGWAVRDQFINISYPLEANNEYSTSQNRPYLLDPIHLVNPSGEIGYFSCYLLDEQGNPYLLSTYEIECSTEE